MYVIDAGWYGNEPNLWWHNTGDWHAGAWLPNGLEPVVEHAHKRGMRFGLWVEIESMGTNSTLRKTHPEWAVLRHGTPAADGRVLDLAIPEVAAWVESEIARLIEQYGLDMFRLDHNHNIGAGRHARARRLRREHALAVLRGPVRHLRPRARAVPRASCSRTARAAAAGSTWAFWGGSTTRNCPTGCVSRAAC